jgi:hypothetical protein
MELWWNANANGVVEAQNRAVENLYQVVADLHHSDEDQETNHSEKRDPDPDPYHSVLDPQHCTPPTVTGRNLYINVLFLRKFFVNLSRK